jgi:hypothetical protein
MRRDYAVLVFAALLVAVIPAPAQAQRSRYNVSQPAVGELYYIEGGIGVWNPDPSIKVSSSRLALIGSEVDAVTDLGITKTRFTDLNLVLRLAKKHKINFEYLPIKYDAESVLTRTIVFGGVSYTIGLPVASTIEFKSYRVGYEYDIFYRDRWYVGVAVDVKFSNASARLSSPIGTASAAQSEPLPGLGAVARVYVAKNVAIGGEFSTFKLPNSLIADYSGHYLDYDIYGRGNFNDHFGAQGGYRSLDLTYRANQDAGDLVLKGFYIKALVRF